MSELATVLPICCSSSLFPRIRPQGGLPGVHRLLLLWLLLTLTEAAVQIVSHEEEEGPATTPCPEYVFGGLALPRVRVWWARDKISPAL